MSNYLNAPQTKMLATRCAICNKELCDAKSVELGIGPDCRAKHGFDMDVPDEVRKAANVEVYKIACNREIPEIVIESCNILMSLGFHKLAGIILDRTSKIQIEEADGVLILTTPFNYAAVAAMRGIPGRRWDKEKKVNTFPVASKPSLWNFLKKFYGGMMAKGPQGGFLIPAA